MQERFEGAFENVERIASLDSFEKYVVFSSQNKAALFRSIREGNCEGLPRFNLWRMLLEVLPIDQKWDQKIQAVQLSRKRWQQLREQAKRVVLVTAAKEPVVNKNPLMKVMAKTTDKKPSDAFLKEQIKKDVDRTYQEMIFFQDKAVLKLLSNVLFVWCKHHPDISYKQGMNELLASIVYVYFQEAVPLDTQASADTQQKFVFLNSVQHAQADTFSVFQKIMQIQKHMYKDNLDGDIKGQLNPNSKINSPILQRIVQIQDQKLKVLDLQLFRIMKLQDVKTRNFLLRWIRCLHTRQFGLVGSFPIWDSIFLDAYESPNSKQANQYQFVDAMCLAMFIYMRSIVLTRQTANEILQIYQKYPQLSGQYLKEMIHLAWSLCQELRNLKYNQGNVTSNWFQQQGKTKNLGLMGRGGYNDTVKKQQNQIKKSPVSYKESTPDVKQQNIKSNAKQQTKREALSQQEVDAYNKSAKQDDLYPQISYVSQNSNVQVTSYNSSVSFTHEQLNEMIENLKKSIALNESIDSRALANKVLKNLQDKIAK